MDKWFLTQTFYNGPQPQTKSIVDSSARGVFLDKEVDVGYDFLSNLATNDHSTSRSLTNKVLEVDALALLTLQMAKLSQKIDTLRSSTSTSPPLSVNAMSVVAPITSSYWEVCGVQGHFGHGCQFRQHQMEQANAFQQRPQNFPPPHNYQNPQNFQPVPQNHPKPSFDQNPLVFRDLHHKISITLITSNPHKISKPHLHKYPLSAYHIWITETYVEHAKD